MNFNKFILSLDNFEIIRKFSNPLTLDLDLIEEPFWNVKELFPKYIKSNDFEKALNLFRNTEKLDNFEKTRFLIHILNELEVIAKLEEMLQTEPDPKLVRAGINEMNKLKNEGIIWELCNDNPLAFKETKMIPYKILYSLRLKKVIVSRIKKRHNKIIRDDS